MKILGFLSKAMIAICLLSTQVSTASTNNKLSKEATNNCSVLAVLTGTTSICPGDTATLTVALSGSSMTTTPNYSVTISNGFTTKTATRVGDGNVTFTVLSSEAGTYAVIEVKDDECTGPATGVAVVTVKQATQIIQQPVDVHVCINTSTTLSVEALGDNLTYEWFKTPLTTPKGTSKNYNIVSAKSEDDGDYTVKVTGTCGVVTSRLAKIQVTLTEVPVVIMSASEKVVCKGGTVTLTAIPQPGGTSPQFTFKNLTTNTILQAASNVRTLTLPNVTSTSEIEVSMLSNSMCLDPNFPNPVKDIISITVVEPEQAVAGQDINTCSPEVNLAGNVPTVGTGKWTCNSGTLSDPTSPISKLSGLVGGTFKTCVWTVANSVCASSSDTVMIYKIGDVTPPNIYLDNVNVTGKIIDLCISGLHSLRGESPSLNPIKGEYIQWSTLSGASVAGVSKQIANHGVLDLVSEGVTKLQYTLLHTASDCHPETRELTLNVHAEPIATVSADITDTCKNVPYINLTTGQLGVTDLGTWTSTLKPTISGDYPHWNWKLSGADLQLGDNTVTWKVENAGCGSRTASQTVKIREFCDTNTIEAILSQGQVFGCKDALASNYNSNATAENGSCEYTQANLSQAKGCSDVKALNYNELVIINVPSSCIYEQSNAFKPIKVLIEDKINTELFTAKVSSACGLDYSKIIDSATVTDVKGLNDKVNVSFKVWQGVKSYDVDVVFDVDLNTILSQTNYLFEATISCANVQARTTTASEGVKIRALLKTSQITGIVSASVSDFIQIIPNPVNNQMSVNLGDDRTAESIEILNQMGVKVLDVSASNTTIDVSVLNAGVYIIKVLDTNGVVYRTKFIKE